MLKVYREIWQQNISCHIAHTTELIFLASLTSCFEALWFSGFMKFLWYGALCS